MERLDYILSSIGAFVGTIITYLFGNWETGISVLFTCMVLDYILGIMCGTKKKELSSSRGFEGLKKKFTIIIILILAVLLDRLIGQGWVFRTLVIYFYIGMEGISILENATILGVPFPDKIKDLLVQLRDGNKKDTSNRIE